jgi:ribosome-associated translation inhibitor RaiA
MGSLDFHIDYYNEINDDEMLYNEAESRILKLADNHNDIIGAMVKLTNQAYGRQTNYANEATIRIFIRGEDVVVTEQAEQPMIALKSALSTIERRVREHRTKLRESSRRGGADGMNEYTEDDTGVRDEVE